MYKVNSSFQRILWLICVELRYKFRIIGSLFLVCFAILIFYFWCVSIKDLALKPEILSHRTLAVSSYLNPMAFKFHIYAFAVALFGLGLVLNSLLFSEYGEEKSKMFHIAIPCAFQEKWLSKLIISLIVYPIVFLLLYQLFAVLTYHWSSKKGFDIVRLNLLDPLLWRYVSYYILGAVTLFGVNTYFRRHTLLKMSVFITLIYFGANVVLNLASLTIYPDFDSSKMVDYFLPGGYENFVMANGYIFDKDYIGIGVILKHPIFITILAVVSIVLSYLKFYELEA